MKLIILAALVLLVTTLVADAWSFKKGTRFGKFSGRYLSSSSSSSSSRHHGNRHNTPNKCLKFCEKSPVLREKLIKTICKDPCDGISCNGKGQCNKGRCLCDKGYTGCNCENVFDPCAQMECFNGGTCNNGSCECTSRFRGDTCDTAVCTRQVNRGASPAFSFDLGPSISRPTNDLTIDACEASCAEAAEAAETDPCRSYEFVTDVNGAQVCILYATDVLTAGIFNPRFALVSPNGTTVGICDPGLNCRRENVITYLGGVPLGADFTIINIDACETICTGISTCGGFVFVPAINLCVTYRNDALLMLASAATVGSCPLVCTRNVNMATSTENGIDISINNIDDCEVGCNVFPGGCRGYQFLTGSNECILYFSDISSSLTSNSNATTAICI